MLDNKNIKYIVGFSAIIVIIVIVFFVFRNIDKPQTSQTNTGVTQTTADIIPDVTQGNAEATINTDISFREIDFSLTQEQIIDKENTLEDTLDNPSIAESNDGYTYITFSSNPQKPLSYNNISVSTVGTSCLTYVLNNGFLEEVRLQFGTLTSDAKSALLDNINTQYGEKTFYRSTNGTETYWWKSSTKLLMLTSDSVGTTLFLRKS